MQKARKHPLQIYMERHGLNNQTAGAQFGCSDTTIARIIADNRPPASALMQRIIDGSGGALVPNDFFVLPKADEQEAAYA